MSIPAFYVIMFFLLSVGITALLCVIWPERDDREYLEDESLKYWNGTEWRER